MLLEACNPLLTEISLNILWGGKEEHVVTELSWSLRQYHASERGESDVNGTWWEDLNSKIFSGGHDVEVLEIGQALLDWLEGKIEAVLWEVL